MVGVVGEREAKYLLFFTQVELMCPFRSACEVVDSIFHQHTSMLVQEIRLAKEL